MKKIVKIILTFLFVFILISCNEEKVDKNGKMENVINIYTLNDFHGAIFENKSAGEIGLSKIGNFLKTVKEKQPNNTVILSAGDMFQGAAVSAMTRGKVVVDIMNYIGFDAMALGNHEFDWGINDIIRYHDGDEENGEANFPFLGANIYHEPSEAFVDWAEPYTVIERGNFKIGILGLMGENLESSIIGSVIKGYEFTSELAAIKKYVPILRNEEGADIVIVVSHNDTSSINYEIRNLEGDQYVDAVVNGHTHQYYAYEETRIDGPPLVVVQSGDNGRFVGHIALEVDKESKKVIDATVGFVSKDKMTTPSTEIEEIINGYQEYIDIENELIGKAGTYINRTIGTRFAANILGKFEDVDVGIINAGGVRSAGFPINDGDDVTYGSIFRIMPFENQVITLNLTGFQLKLFLGVRSDLRFSDSLNTLNLTIRGKAIEDTEVYKIAIIDFAYYRFEYMLQDGTEMTIHDVLVRDLLVDAVREIVEEEGRWYIK